MSTQQIVPDQKSRQRALDVSTSWSVTAPAGSGKTGLLTQRILRLLSVIDRPEAILAITFTRKAAAEMRNRIMDTLRSASDPEPVTEGLADHEIQSLNLARLALQQNQRQGWNLLDNPNRLHIQTIDSFCRRLATSLPLESGVSLPPGVADDVGLLYQTAARRTVAHLESRHPVADDLEFLLTHLSVGIEQLNEMLGNLLKSRDSWLPLISQQRLSKAWLEEALDQLLIEKFEDARQLVEPFSIALDDLVCHAQEQGGDALDGNLDPAVLKHSGKSRTRELAAWHSLANFLLQKGKAQALKTVNKSRGFVAGDRRKAEMHDLLAQIADNPSLVRNLHSLRGLPAPDVSEEQWQLIQAFVRVVSIGAAELRLLEQELGLCDHTEIAIAALRALGEPDQPTPLAERLDYRIQHILVDEFQDTSSTQVQLLERLIAGWQPDDGRSLFLVGDAMQSIYEFRKANVELFQRICQQGIQDIQFDPLTLVANFRSRPALVDKTNQIFSQALGPLGSQHQGFTPALANRPDDQNAGIRFTCHNSDKDEAEAAARHIEKLLEQGEEDIALLVRNRNHLASILPALREHQIEWQAQDIDPLNSRMAVLDLDSLTRALCCPGDRIAWLALLRAPWAGLDNADLLTLTNHADSEGKSLFEAITTADSQLQLSPTGKVILKRLGEVLGAALSNLGQLPLRWVVERSWGDLGGAEGLFNISDLDNVQDYLNLVESQDSGGMIGDWEAFDLALKKLYARPTVDNQPKVQIMTMHKAKGLEFDHVILPALAKTNSAGGPSPLLVWWEREFRDGHLRFLLSPKAAKGSDNSLYSYLLEEQKERQLQEQLRILYVAMTRAKESLLISATLDFTDEGEPKPPGKNSLIYGVWDVLKDEFEIPAFKGEELEATPQIRELRHIRRLPPLRKSNSSLRQADNPETQITDSRFSVRYVSRCVGDILHEDLQRVHNHFDDSDLLDECRNSWEHRLQRRGLTKSQVEIASRRLSRAVTKLLGSSTAQWIFQPRDSSAAESSYAVRQANGGIRHRVIDRTFVESGQRWIIDYKTAEPGEEESMEDFLREQVERYRSQLRGYEEIFSDYPVCKALYFPLLDQLQKLD